MAVKRDSLRARSDFFSPMTGNTSGTRFAGERRGSYTDEAKRRLQDLDTGRTESPVIEAIKVALEKTPDPFTKIPTKKSYAPEEDQGLAGVLEGLGDGEEVVKAVGDFIEPITSGGGGTSPNDKRLQRQADFDANPPAKASTSQLIARDNRRYGNTFPSGSMGSGSEATIKASPTSKVDTNIARHAVGGPGDQPEKPKETRTYYGQGGLPLGTTTQRQGGEVKDGKYVGPQEKGPAINASSFLQKNLRGGRKDESARPTTVTIGGQTVAAKQTVASLPSNYKSTEAKAFAAAKAYKGQQAAAKAASEGKTKAQQSAAARKATGTSVSAAKAANKASMKAAAAARHASFKKAKAAGTHARTASAQRARNKAAAKARAKAAAKRRRSKKKCDITIKYDISKLTSMNLLRDDLANVAYFVKELQETI